MLDDSFVDYQETLREAGRALGQSLRRELRITYALLRRDLPASIGAGTMFTGAALAYDHQTAPTRVLHVMVLSLCYHVVWIYCFCFANQITGLAEDRLNKPDRPIPAGLVSMSGACQRWLLAMAAFPFVSYTLGGATIMAWALMWQLVIVAYNFGGLDRHWFSKNFVFMPTAVVLQLAPSWAIATHLNALAWRWILVVAATFCGVLQLQDLRDVPGDLAMKRRTLPVVLGERKTRWITALSISVAVPLVVHFFLMRRHVHAPIVLAWDVGLGLLCLVVAARVLLWRTRRDDHRTYMLYTWWFCLILASGIFVAPFG
jgi:4-hydroxybenzoate polyprenyltransferase